MAVLFTFNWDIISGKEKEYAKFIEETFLVETSAMGLPSDGGYYVEVGFGPRIIGVHSCNDLQELGGVIASQKFKDLILTLKSIVRDYRTAILEPTGRIARTKYKIAEGAWKLNQYWDIRPGKKEEYIDYIMNVFVPALEKINYLELTGGWNVAVGGISEIISELTFKDPVDIGRILNNEDFRRVIQNLRTNYVSNYQSRILRCTERFEEIKWQWPT